MYLEIVFDIINLTSLNSVERSMDGFTFHKKELMALISGDKKEGVLKRTSYDAVITVIISAKKNGV